MKQGKITCGLGLGAEVPRVLFPIRTADFQALLRRVHALNVPRAYVESLVPFRIQGQVVGYCKHVFAQKLATFVETFQLAEGGRLLELTPEVDRMDLAGRTRAVHQVNLALHEARLVPGWRSEMLEVSLSFGDSPMLLLERAAAPHFGIKAYGIHVNGFVSGENGKVSHLWVGKRSRAKSTWPGMYDHIVAGGLPHGVGLMDNVAKECEEEASIPRSLASQAVQTSVLSYCGLDEHGNLKRDTIYCYDLHLPRSFVPRPADGEVEQFSLESLDWVWGRLLGHADHDALPDGVDYKPNCHLVLIDFFIRHGLVDASPLQLETLRTSLRVEL